MTLPAANEVVIKLPHPYLTSYTLIRTERKSESGASLLQVKPFSTNDSSNGKTKLLPEPLHRDGLSFTEPADLKSSERPPESNNTPWGRARRVPSSTFVWGADATPTLAQAWLLVYVLFTIRPSTESLRLSLSGRGADDLAAQLRAVLLAIDHPASAGEGPSSKQQGAGAGTGELLLLRSAFWQGAGSPFGPRPVWVPDYNCQVDDHPRNKDDLSKPLSQYPPTPLSHTMTSDPSGGQPTAWHPRRAAKPRPGSVVYSRWIPHLGETFSMVALDYRSEEHLGLFHSWQNDPRVSQGWNETGTLDQHREYLRRAHEDPHQITLLARFDDAYFAYFEVYWAKVRFILRHLLHVRCVHYMRLGQKLMLNNRRTVWARTTMRATSTGAGTRWWAKCGSGALTG